MWDLNRCCSTWNSRKRCPPWLAPLRTPKQNSIFALLEPPNPLGRSSCNSQGGECCVSTRWYPSHTIGMDRRIFETLAKGAAWTKRTRATWIRGNWSITGNAQVALGQSILCSCRWYKCLWSLASDEAMGSGVPWSVLEWVGHANWGTLGLGSFSKTLSRCAKMVTRMIPKWVLFTDFVKDVLLVEFTTESEGRGCEPGQCDGMLLTDIYILWLHIRSPSIMEDTGVLHLFHISQRSHAITATGLPISTEPFIVVTMAIACFYQSFPRQHHPEPLIH